MMRNKRNLKKQVSIIITTTILICGFFNSCKQTNNIKWLVIVEQPGKEATEIGSFYDDSKMPVHFTKTVDGILVDASIERKDDLLLFHGTANTEATEKKCFLSLKAEYNSGTAYSYNGLTEESKVFRQSPHDPKNHVFPKLVKQAIPMVAVKEDQDFVVAISDCPAFYDNYTTQRFNTEKQTVALCFGDNGDARGSDPEKVKIEAYYHSISKGNPKSFDGIIFRSSAQDLNNLRKDVLLAIAKRWGDHVDNRFGATAFSTNYMLVRKNETGKSNYWVVPAIEYANKQYSRDAFWQSMVLPAKYSRECYLNEAVDQTPGAERPLFCMIWAYRTKLEGGEPDMEAAQKTLAYIEEHTKNGWYYSYNKKQGKMDFQSWYDTAAFEKDDVITYNQGLLAVALMSAEALGLKPSVTSAMAIQNYQSMFNKEKGYFPLSQMKDLLAVDPLVGDLLAQLYFDKPLLSDESVVSHYNRIISNAKTKFGYKVTCLPNGDYAPAEAYGASGHVCDWTEMGGYQWSGSWFLYDLLFLTDSYLHHAPGASAEIKWRSALDFELGGTYFEYIHTVTGEPNKPNQGWNAAIYAINKKLKKDKKISESFFSEIK